MVYPFYIETPANTTESNPLITNIKATRGIITQYMVNFPPGSHTLLRWALKSGSSPLIPTDPGRYLRGDDSFSGSNIFVPFIIEPYILQIHTWNEDDTHSHICFGDITINHLWALSPFSEGFRELQDKEENIF